MGQVPKEAASVLMEPGAWHSGRWKHLAPQVKTLQQKGQGAALCVYGGFTTQSWWTKSLAISN